MDMLYFKTAAQLGITNLHPKGIAGTQKLITALRLQDGYEILEIGCGTGETLIRILSDKRVSINAIDAIPQMITRARFRLHLVGLTHCVKFHCVKPGARFPLDDHMQDRVYHESVIAFQDTHVIRMMLDEVYRVLKS